MDRQTQYYTCLMPEYWGKGEHKSESKIPLWPSLNKNCSCTHTHTHTLSLSLLHSHKIYTTHDCHSGTALLVRTPFTSTTTISWKYNNIIIVVFVSGVCSCAYHRHVYNWGTLRSSFVQPDLIFRVSCSIREVPLSMSFT